MDATLNVEFVTLVHILLYSLRQTTPKNEVVPLSTLGHLSSIRKSISAIRCCKRNTRNRHVTIYITHIGLTSHVTYKYYFIY